MKNVVMSSKEYLIVREHNPEDKSCLVFSCITIKPVVYLKISTGGGGIWF